MASRLMHYIIANEIIKQTPYNKDLFILGNLAPDAHNGTLEGNSSSHFRYIINDQFDKFPNIDLNRFKEKYLNFPDDFMMGYFCHLLSDDIWVKLLYPNYLKFDLDEELFRKQREEVINDFYALNYILLEHYGYCFENDIEIPENLSVSEFNKNKLIILLDNLYNDFHKKSREFELKIFNIDFIHRYINISVNACLKDLNNII